MAGEIFTKERAVITLTSTGASLTNNSAALVGTTLDLRSGGNAGQDFDAKFEWVGQWATITGITAATVIGELYLVPSLDGTNFPDVDTTAGASTLPAGTLVAVFTPGKAPSANTNLRVPSNDVRGLIPALYRVYVKNKSGQTMAANWSLSVVTARGQYS